VTSSSVVCFYVLSLQVETALKLINNHSIDKLEALGSAEADALAKYMYHAGQFYNAFDIKRTKPDSAATTKPVLSIQDRVTSLKDAHSFFASV